jgi:hypothetical protein
MQKPKSNSAPPLKSGADAEQFEWIGEDVRPAAQPPLFPDAELILPAKVKNLPPLKKAIAAIHSVPSTTLGLNGRRLFDALIMAIQLDFKSRPELTIERIRDDRVSPLFDVRVTDLAKLAGIVGKNYERIYKELAELRKTDVSWNVVGEDGSVDMDYEASFLSLLGIGRSDGLKKGMIRFACDPAVLVLLLEPSIWASLSLQTMHALKTSPAYALYQNTFKYIGTQQKVTPSFPTETWILLIVGPSRFCKTDVATGKTVTNYKDFKRKIFLPAIKEINNHPALAYELELTEKKRGNRVAELQFKFVLKKQRSLDLPITWDENLRKALAEIGLDQEKINELAQRFPMGKVVEALKILPVQLQRMQSQGIRLKTSRAAYFEGILNKIMEVETVTVETLDEAASQAEIQHASERAARDKSEFEQFQAKRFVDAIFERSDRDDLIALFLKSSEGQTQTIQAVAKKGINKNSVAFWGLFKSWAKKEMPMLQNEIFKLPHERDLQSWLSWRLEQLS